MDLTQFTLEVTDPNLRRVAQILPQYITDLKCVLRLRDVGSWSMSLPSDLPAARLLAQPGAGILITGPGPLGIFSGPVTSITEKADTTDPDGTLTFVGTDWNVLLADALTYPTPSTADLTAQTDAYYTLTGYADAVIRSLVDANIGENAPAGRRGHFASLLVSSPDHQRGPQVTASVRFDNLLTAAASLAKLAGLGFRVRVTDDGSGLRFEIFTPADRSKTVRLDFQNGRLTSYEYGVTAPTQTEVIVGGQGEGAARTFIGRTTTTAQTAEAAWGRRIEVFKDERNTNDPTELAQAGDEILAEGGQTVETLKIVPTDDLTMLYLRDWNLGDYVTVVVRDVEVTQIITQVGITVTKDGAFIGAVGGDLDATDVRALTLLSRIRHLETRI